MTQAWNELAAQAVRPEVAVKNGLPLLRADDVMAYVDPSLAEHPDFHDGWGAVRERCVPMLVQSRSGHRSRITVTDADAERLTRLWKRPPARADEEHLAALKAELDRAAIVSARKVPDDVVTMNSCVLCEDPATGVRAKLRLVYPKDMQRSALSILSPVGTALLGLAVGHPVPLPADHALASRLRVRALPYQPERAGHFHM